MTYKFSDIRRELTIKKPLIHCITNPISINQCANAILSLGAKPIMAEHPKEVCEITNSADALMLNIANITDARMESIMISATKAKNENIPCLLDVVGIACSKLRRQYVSRLLKIANPSVIKGNYSEIVSLYNSHYFSKGVDADTTLGVDNTTDMARKVALKYKTVILATGETDIITDGKSVMYVKNGVSQLSEVTGTGCMLGAVCAAFMTTLSPLEAAVSSCIYFGICGEMAETKSGNGSFMVNLMDKISTLGSEEILKYMNMEEK